jgi:hypothetical protein
VCVACMCVCVCVVRVVCVCVLCVCCVYVRVVCVCVCKLAKQNYRQTAKSEPTCGSDPRPADDEGQDAHDS